MTVQKTDYPGIDYGRGLVNIDKETGIRYGIIHSSSLHPEALGDFEPVYDPHCPSCGLDLAETEDSDCDHCPDCDLFFENGEQYGDEPSSTIYVGEGYELSLDEHGDVWVFKSPFVTRVQFCSPCAPGAGDLTSPCDAGALAYCLGADWFEDDTPYDVKRV